MRLPHLLLLLPMLWLAMGCAGNRRVGEGRFQKRQHQPGWHVDMGRPAATPAATPVARERAVTMETRITAPVSEPVYVAPAMASAQTSASAATADMNTRPITAETGMVTSDAPTISYQDDDYAGDRPRGAVSRTALVALALVVGAIVTAFMSNSALLVALIVTAGIVLAAIALRRIRSLEQQGKGFALVALILGLATALLTLMMIVRTGW